MSAAASAVSPAIVRTPSSRNVPPAVDQPTRTRSTARRTASSSRHSHRSDSRSHVDGALPVRDQETTNLARTTSRRSTSREGQHRTDSTRSHRAHSRHESSPHRTEMSTATTVIANGTSPATQPPSTTAHPERPPAITQTSSARRRTSITTQTGTWLLGKTIGQGSMGKVKLAKNLETGEQVAIKIVPRQALDEHGNPKDDRADRSKEIRTAREAAMVSLLDHPFVCGMRDVQRTGYHWYMLFEYVNGGQMLDYIISHGRLKEKQARKFGRQIASALDYCHRNSIVHRDLKIENILISKTGDIKIIDFGLSNLFSPRSLLKTFCGSLYFAAPELLQARQYTGPEVDVWSFGIVLYVLVCGKVPFDDQSMPQLHAKIKRGIVDYPQWLSVECKSIIGRMLVVDPKERATLQEIMNHPWMIKGFNTPPENYLPYREPLQLPLDPEIIEKMTGFDFGSPAYITEQLTRLLESDDYQNAVRRNTRDDAFHSQGGEKKRGVFDFYKRRNSISREGLSTPSSEAIRGMDPTNAYSPLISIYHLAREKRDRERMETNPGALAMPTSPGEKPLKMPDLPPPEAAYTNQHSYELSGENTTGGRSRPRARTHGDDEVTQDLKKLDIGGTRRGPSAGAMLSAPSDQAPKKEGTAMGLLRRLSTRRNRDRDSDRQTAPSLTIQPPADLATPPRKSFSVRKSRRRDPSPSTAHPGGSQPQPEGLLNAPATDTGSSHSSKLLGRSTSVNSADFRPRRFANRGVSEALDSPRLAPEPPATSGSDHSSISGQRMHRGVDLTDKVAPDATPLVAPRSPTSNRTKSLGHARREGIQARRQRREDAIRDREANVPEETDAELRDEADATDSAVAPGSSGMAEASKPVYLKGLFSVSTTSNKPVPFIRQDVIRVLKQLGVEFTEIKGGFSCRHAPSINLEAIKDPTSPMEEDRSGRVVSGHQRKISFGAFRGRERDDIRDERATRHASRRGPPDRSFISNSEGSEEYVERNGNGSGRDVEDGGRDMGATTTKVQNDTGDNLVLRFEIFIVKIPLFSLHGIQFKKIQGGMNQYKQMGQKIVDSLRL